MRRWILWSGLILVAGFAIYAFVSLKMTGPNPITTADQSGVVSGVVRKGPTNPLGGFCSSPADNVEVLFVDSQGRTYKVLTDSTGHYDITIPTGEYQVGYQIGNGVLMGDLKNKGKLGFGVNVVVEKDKSVTFDGCFDTGIR